MIRLGLFFGTRPLVWGMTAVAGVLLLGIAAMEVLLDERRTGE